MKVRLAIDLGAESGRVVATGIDGPRLLVEELHRFGHAPQALPTGLHWDITGLWRGILAGLQAAAGWAAQRQHEIVSVGVDSWGVDWAMVDASGELAGLPHAYRDPRNADWSRRVQAELGIETIYRTTGIQMMPFNSLYSVRAQCEMSPALVSAAQRLLFIPDLFHYWLSGEMAVERTIASTSQMLNVHSGDWAGDLLREAGIPAGILGPLVPAGTVLGRLREEVAAETGLSRSTLVIAPAAHDTASAVVAVPADPATRWCFLSSGTWSLLGAELQQPLVSAESQRHMFTNEAGFGGTIRFLKNIAGLWLVQQCRAVWQRQGREWGYAELAELAAAAEGKRTLIDPAADEFYAPADMVAAIAEAARRTGQPVPNTAGEFVRCCLDSLAVAYREVLEQLESCLGQSFDVIHIVGGGAQNRLLNRLVAEFTGRTVVAGPVEATAIGNGLVQAIAVGELTGLEDARRLVRESGLLIGPESRGG